MPHNHDSNQMNISYELLMLLQWLLEHEEESMRKLISKALHNGLAKQLDAATSQKARHEAAMELQESIIDFFTFLETEIHLLMNEDNALETIQRTMLPALKQVDARTYSHGALESSIAKAEAAFGKHAIGTPKEILCKELLKRWKPSKKLTVN